MKAMILGAGIGSRLDPLTRSLPKPLVPIVGKPVLGHLIELLGQHGVAEIMVNIQHLGDKIKEAIGDGSGYGLPVCFSQEEELCGDAGGVKRCEAFFREGGDPFLVIGGDDLTDTNLGRVVAEHKARKATATLAVTPVEDPSEYGIVVLDHEGYITRFQEKPEPGKAFSNLANTGIYVFQTRVFDFIPAGTFFGFGKDVFPALMEAGEPMAGVPSEAYWKDVGNPVIYRQAQRDCMDGRCTVRFPVPEVHPKVWMGKRTDIAADASLRGPLVVGNNCRVGEGAFLGDYTVLGDGCIVEAGAVLRDSILWPGAVVKRGTHLENCIVGSGAQVSSSVAIFQGLIMDARRPETADKTAKQEREK